MTTNGRDHDLRDVSILRTYSSGVETLVLIINELDGIVEVVLKTSVSITACHEVALVKLHLSDREIIEIEVDGFLILMVQVESDTPYIVSGNRHGLLKLLPFC